MRAGLQTREGDIGWILWPEALSSLASTSSAVVKAMSPEPGDLRQQFDLSWALRQPRLADTVWNLE